MPFRPGENVGPYRILEQLGQGGMATVYKAYHPALDRYVAIKVLHQAFLEDASFQARFLREARLVAKLEHPNIVPIYDYAEHEQQPYLVMKYIEGETLKARLARSPLAADEITKIVKSVGQALAYAHQQGILHRDVKPSNVMLANDGQIYLADFGLARIAQAGESTLSSDMILGTPQYISPEQAIGKKELDAGTDIYSFGVMIYEMVVGRVPFSADTPFSIIHDHIYTPLPLPRSINPNVPEDVERVLLKCLAKERADRYATINDLVEAFLTAWNISGIIGHAATLAMPVRPEVPAAGEAVTIAPSTSPVTEKKKETVTTVPTLTKPPRRRLSWKLIASTTLLVLCCLFAALAARNRRLQIPYSLLTPQIPLPTSISPVSTHTPMLLTPVPSNTALPPDVASALQEVEKNPNDAYAHLRLALAFFDAHMERSYLEELAKAADLAKDDQPFFRDAGMQLTNRQAWVGAAAMYLRFAGLQPADKPLPNEIYNLLQESVYKGAASPEFPEFIPFARVREQDQPLGLVAESRHAYYNGDKPKAHTILKEVKRIKPKFQTAMLLEAEYNFNEGRVDDARILLNLLTADLSTPEWIRMEAEKILKKLP
jgi:tRNA A-37 threonylcarbamoyl transferase component Bud32